MTKGPWRAVFVRPAVSSNFATPSPRLIPEGEKPDTFTGLALAPKEGGT